ncbi:MAG TPA: hypothetical protein VJZ04_03085 [Lachnospiraceae bacterium]|nr:hypothetical protein [Lachnospiraceae bacterium]
MATSISSINDYSYLFSNLNSSNKNKNANFNSSLSSFSLSDYASIKNGSYYKLTKAYYAKNNDNSSSTSISADNSKTLATIKSDSASLAKSSDALVTTGSKSLFHKIDITTKKEDGTTSTSKGYDTDAIFKGVNKFVNDYNSLIESGGKSDTKSILRNTLSITNLTNAHSNLLSKVGITMNSDNTLSIDEESFKSSDVTSMKSLFNGSGSYAYSIGSYSTQIGYYAEAEGNKANTYSDSGAYISAQSSGNIYDNYL